MNNEFWDQDRTLLNDHKKNKRKNWFAELPVLQKAGYIFIALFVMFWFSYIGFAYSTTIPSHYDGPVVSGRDVNPDAEAWDLEDLEGVDVVLLVGSDSRGANDQGRTDTIMVAFYDKTNNSLKILSLPRDIYVQIPGTSTKTKINHAYHYGGIDLLEETIEYLLGVNITRYAEINFDSFEKVIDAIGGVYIDVEMDMKKLSEGIDLKKGYQKLNGADALAYVRFRGTPSADLGRIERQQKFLLALADQLISPSNIIKVSQLVTIFTNNVNTNYGFKDLLPLGKQAMRMDISKIEFFTVPVYDITMGGVSYLGVKGSDLQKMMEEIAGGEFSGKVNAIQGVSDPDPDPEPETTEDPIQDPNQDPTQDPDPTSNPEQNQNQNPNPNIPDPLDIPEPPED